jgi:predicted amidohydrolase
MLRVALVQTTTGLDAVANAAALTAAIDAAATRGAGFILTPEMSGRLDRDAVRLRAHAMAEDDDPVLAAVRAAAVRHDVWVLIGSLALRAEDDGGRLANRSLLVDSAGEVRARYDKMHLFDVEAAPGETYRESASFRPGSVAVVADTPWARVGLSICYDLRFPRLYDALTGAGATILTVPAAFTRPTGAAHWHALLRARAIETGSFVLAPAQTGLHEDGRSTFGHSLAINPWGDILLDMGEAPGIGIVELDLAEVARVRARIPVLDHRREIAQP